MSRQCLCGTATLLLAILANVSMGVWLGREVRTNQWSGVQGGTTGIPRQTPCFVSPCRPIAKAMGMQDECS